MLALLLFVAGACTRSDPAPDGVLRVQMTAEPVSLDPAYAEDGIAMRVLGNTLDGLYGIGPTGEMEPRLASSYKVENGGLRYRFRLRPDAKWSDGVPVTADHFVAGIRRSLDPKTLSKQRAFLKHIEGPNSVRAERHADSMEVVIDLSRKNPFFLKMLGLIAFLPVRPEILAQNGGRWPVIAPGTGPYAITEVRKDRSLILKRNLHWVHPKDRAIIPVIELLLVGDETTGLNLFEQNRIDILSRVPSYDYPRLRDSGVLRDDRVAAIYYLAFNLRRSAVLTKEVREAISRAIDPAAIVKLLGTGELPARSWIPPGYDGYDPYPTYRATPPVSKTLHGLKLEIAYDTSARNTMILEKIQHDLADAVGAQVTLKNADWKTHVATLNSLGAKSVELYRYGWISPVLDEWTFLQVFTSQSPNNYTGWKNSRYDQLVEEIFSSERGPERMIKIVEAQRLLIDQDRVIVPIYHYVQTHAVSTRVTGFAVTPSGVVRFSDLQLTR
jgi:oligopeptide transport system substrate-binding protein